MAEKNKRYRAVINSSKFVKDTWICDNFLRCDISGLILIKYWASKGTENASKKRTGLSDRSSSLSFGSGTIRSWDRERGFREIRSNGGSASTRLCIGPYMVASRICLYIGRARKRGRIRNREAAGTHTHPLRIRFAKFFSFFLSFCTAMWAYEAFVRVRTSTRLVCLAARNGKRRGRDLDCPQPRRSAAR